MFCTALGGNLLLSSAFAYCIIICVAVSFAFVLVFLSSDFGTLLEVSRSEFCLRDSWAVLSYALCIYKLCKIFLQYIAAYDYDLPSVCASKCMFSVMLLVACSHDVVYNSICCPP